jgi:hypothetical protein
MSQLIPAVDHSLRAHSRISPSKLKPLQLCPGYESDDTPSRAADRGTSLHEIMDSGKIPDDLAAEDRDIALQVLATLEKIESQSPYEPLKEIELDFTSLELKDFEKGHADRVIVLEADENHDPVFVEMIDFKFGRWEVDHVSENIQFRAYVLGLFILFPTITRVRARLIQPALDKDESHVFGRGKDFDLIVSQIGAIVRRRHRYLETGDKEMLRPNNDFCGFCARQAQCPAWQEYMSKLANDADLFGHAVAPLDSLEHPELANPDEVLRAFRWVKPMEDYLKKFKRFVLAVHDLGHMDGGVTIVEKSGDATVVDPIATARILREEFGVTLDEFVSACDVSITKIKQLVGSHAKTGEKGDMQTRAIDQLAKHGLIQYGPRIRYAQLKRGKAS